MNHVEKLQSETTAVKVSFTWASASKTIDADHRETMAATVNADSSFVRASKRLLDTKHDALRALTTIKNEIKKYWVSMTLPYPEDGIRLLRQADVEKFVETVTDMRDRLSAAAKEADNCYSELRNEACERLGDLYNSDDYPDSLANEFTVRWEFPSVNPPDYLMKLHPGLYEQEVAKCKAKLQHAVTLAEEAFQTEFATLLDVLTDKLTGTNDGKPKRFTESSVENLVDFFVKFKHLNITSSADLDALVEKAQSIVVGLSAKELKHNETLKQTIAAKLGEVQTTLEGMMVNKPARALKIKAKKKEASSPESPLPEAAVA